MARWGGYCDADAIADYSCDFCGHNAMEDESVIVFSYDSLNVQGYLGLKVHGGPLVVSFRGTMPDSVTNWWDDFDTAWQTVDLDGESGNLPPIQFHDGFFAAYDGVRAQIFDALAKLDPTGVRPIEVVGHSLGGALAHLCAFDLTSRGGHDRVDRTVSRVITFGAPRVGRGESWELAYAERLAEQTWRITHHRDIVPSVPPAAFGFVHVPTEIFYDDTSSHVCNGSGEDPDCHNGYSITTSVSDHTHYMGLHICGCGEDDGHDAA